MNDTPLTFDADYEGSCLGAIKKISEGFYAIDLRADTWYYFNFRMRGCKDKELIFTFNCREIKAKGYEGGYFRWLYDNKYVTKPVVSYDNGKTWEIIPNIVPGSMLGNFIFHHTFREDEAIIAYAPWYRYSDLLKFLDGYCQDPRVTRGSIGTSRCGYDMPRLTITKNPQAKQTVLLISREDTDEMTGSFAMEGMLNYLLSNTPETEQFLENTIFECIPMVEIDGVVSGATHSAGYDYGGSWWHKPDAPKVIDNVRKFTVQLAQEGRQFVLAGKLHGGMSLEPTHSINYLTSSLKLRDALENVTTEYWNPTQKRNPRIAYSEPLCIRPQGFFERYMLETYGLYDTFGVHVQGTTFDNLRYCGRDLMKALLAFLKNR